MTGDGSYERDRGHITPRITADGNGTAIRWSPGVTA